MTRRLEDIIDECRVFDLSLRPQGKVQSLRFGDWDSLYRGEGFDFEDLREYELGDTMRRVHTPSSLRLGKLMTVQRRELREIRTLFILDLSNSMRLRENMDVAFGVFGLTALASLDL